MMLREAIEKFIAYRRSLGTDFTTESNVLERFLKKFGGDVDSDDVTGEQVLSFLAGNGPLTQTRALRYSVLKGFFCYAIARDYATRSPLPLPQDEPRRPKPRPAYIYTREELRRLLDTLAAPRRRPSQLDVQTFRTFLLLLYGIGLRGSEARHLTVTDVDLTDAVLNVRDSKFFKSRLVPVGPQLADVLRDYANHRATRPFLDGKDSPFLSKRDGTMLPRSTVTTAFQHLRRRAGISLTDGTRLSPSLHSLRHSFAVHRLTAWYRQGADVQRLLPVLSTYLGHASVTETQVYLSMTPELLQEASLRYERYVRGHGDE